MHVSPFIISMICLGGLKCLPAGEQGEKDRTFLRHILSVCVLNMSWKQWHELNLIAQQFQLETSNWAFPKNGGKQ